MDLEEFLAEWHNDSPCVNVHTSGSTGQPKPMLVEKRRMEASARITCDFLGLKEGDSALLCMSLDYIAGKMMVVRAMERGLRLVTVPPSGHPLQKSVAEEDVLTFAAMVPLQVYNALQVDEERERLRQIRHLIIGGGAIDESLAEGLKDFPYAVWSTYGMTETLSHIALRRINGPEASDWYTPFPSVGVSVSADDCLVIDAPEVCAERLVTHDIVELVQTEQGTRFRILGRKDNIICSGGIKIQAEEVERLLRPHLSAPYIITKRADTKFGEIVVLLTEGPADEARAVCETVLSGYLRPRGYIHVDKIPLTETGKPARQRILEIARHSTLQ